jgi:hypothetical protein
MVINELMSSSKWKGVKMWQRIAATSKISLQAKYFNQQNLVAGGVKAEPEKFGHLATHAKIRLDKRKRKGIKVQPARVCHQRNLVPRLKILKCQGEN